MNEDFYPVPGLEGSVPATAPGVPRRSSSLGRRLGLAAVSTALVAGLGLGAYTLGTTATEDEPGPGATTSQGPSGDEAGSAVAPAPAPVAHEGQDRNED